MEKSILHRKDSIISSTIEMVDEVGIQRLSTKELAKRMGISEGTIFNHFKTKDALLLAVLEHFSQYDEDIISAVELNDMNPIEAIQYFVNCYATYYENYPAITAITQVYDILRYDPKLSEKARSIFSKRTDFLVRMIKGAQSLGEISKEIDSEFLAVAIMGLNREFCLKWRMEGYAFPLRENIMSSLKTLLNAFKTNYTKDSK